MALATFYTRDSGVSLTFTLTCGTSAINLSGATVTLYAGIKSFTMSVLSAGSGIVQHMTRALQFDAGDHFCQIKWDNSAGTFYTSNFVLNVRQVLGG